MMKKIYTVKTAKALWNRLEKNPDLEIVGQTLNCNDKLIEVDLAEHKAKTK